MGKQINMLLCMKGVSNSFDFCTADRCVLVEGDGHAVGLEPAAALAGGGAGRVAHVVQVVVAGLELVLQIHGLVLRWALLRARPAGKGLKTGQGPRLIRGWASAFR